MAFVTAVLGEGTEVTLEARQFSWRSDEPFGKGKRDLGPTPYEMLLGSLAACIVITLRLYADHKGITLPEVGVRLDLDRVHADDCVDSDERADARIERITSQVTIRGTFDDAQRARLTQVARRCPVHKTLVNGAQLVDSVVFEPSA